MLKHELRCEICHTKFDSHYNIPKVLTCGHTICSRCLDRMRDKNINRCPFDRKLIEYDEDKVPNNFYILSLIDGSIKGNVCSYEPEKEDEELELTPKTVVNNPGWKNTLAGFIKNDVLYTAESNGFIYCTDLNTGEWWFLYLSQFWGNHFFLNPYSHKMFLIDHNGSLFQLFHKNYYTQIGKKNSWKNTSHLCVFDHKMYSVETSDKLYETCLENGKWKEIGSRKIEDVDLNDENNENSEENSENGENESGVNNMTENSNGLINSMRSNNFTNTGRENVEGAISNNQNSQNINISYDNPLFQFNIAGFNLRIPNFLNTLTSFSRNKILTNVSSSDIAGNKISLKQKEQVYFNVKDTVMLVATKKNVLISNKFGDLYKLDVVTGQSKLLKNDFYGNIASYSNNLTHVYFFEKGSRIIHRINIKDDEININDYYLEYMEKESNVSEMQKKFNNLNLNLFSEKMKSSQTLKNNQTESNVNNLVNNANSSGNSNYNLGYFLENESIPTHDSNQELHGKTISNTISAANSNLESNNNIISNLSLKNSSDNKNAVGTKINSSSNIVNNETLNNLNISYLQVEKFIELDESINPIKVISSESRVVVIDKKGDLWVYDIESKERKTYQCLFMLRNCHMQNSIIMGDGDLVILDPIRLSLNKLNILTGTEVIMLHSLKFLSTIKHIFSSGTKLYFIDVSGNLYNFLETEKKIAQIGSSGICKYIIDSAVYKNFLFSIENNILYKTNLNDGSFVEIKNEYTQNYKYFFSDYVQLIFISKDDFIFLVTPGESLKLKQKFYYPNISKIQPLTYFKNHIIFYNHENGSIDGIDIEKYEMTEEIKEKNDLGEKDEKIKFEINSKMVNETENNLRGKLKSNVMIEDFPEVLMFINNNECLACILKDGLIYKLYC